MTQKNQKDLFTRAFNLETEIVSAQELLKELKSEFTYHAEDNPEGLDKEIVTKTMKASKARAKEVALKEKADELLEINRIVEELS